MLTQRLPWASGTLRIGLTVATGGQALTRLATAFGAAHPDCQVTLTEEGIADPYGPLRRDDIDVLVNWLAVDEPDLTAGPVIDRCDRALAVAADHPTSPRCRWPSEPTSSSSPSPACRRCR